MNKQNDPADWKAASYSHHPVDDMEPLNPASTDYQICSRHFRGKMNLIDKVMCPFGITPKTPRSWVAVSFVFALDSTKFHTETSVALIYGITRAAVSKDVVRCLIVTRMEHTPALGLKSFADRQLFKITNGRRAAQRVGVRRIPAAAGSA
jgi:hypothetical protein